MTNAKDNQKETKAASNENHHKAMEQETLTDAVYEDIRKKVVSGEWPVGMRINEKELSKVMHVSRTPIRRALHDIYREGLLEYTENRGYSVRVVTADDVEEIYLIREALEILATERASKIMTEDDFAELEGYLCASEEAISKDERDVLLRNSDAFNYAIYRFVKMPRLQKIQQTLQEYLLRFRDISFKGEIDDRRIQAVAEHRIIFRLMKNRDHDLLGMVIREHLSHSKKYILQEIKKAEKKQ